MPDEAESKLSSDSAQALLNIEFTSQDRGRMMELAAKSGAGSISVSEESELAEFRRVARLLDILRAKAFYAQHKSDSLE